MDDTTTANNGGDGFQKEDSALRTRTRTRARGADEPVEAGAESTAPGRAEGPGGRVQTGRAEGPGGRAQTGRAEGPGGRAQTGRAEGPGGRVSDGADPDRDDGPGLVGTSQAVAAEDAKPSRRRRRGRRGRKRGSSGEREGAAVEQHSADTTGAEVAADAQSEGGTRAEASSATSDSQAQTSVEGQIARSGTRLTAKRQTGQRGRRRLTRARHARAQAPALAEDVRRAILQNVPRTMLVTTSKDRTQIAVLEDRTVAEHYVTRKEDVSFVGNIYMARVQNVLPGMEAAFLDFGKGRNGVLYAGEVLYDELDSDNESRLRIEHALKPGQKVLVQVTKDPMGTKGARLTMQLSLAGRYMVLAPNDGTLGISRKLSDDERERLRKILKKIKPEGAGIIVRTAAAEATEEQLREDLERLLQKWETVAARGATANVLEPVYEEPDLVVRVIRDHFGPEFLKLIVDDADVHTKVQAYLEEVMPDAVGKLELYQPTPTRKDELPESLFDAYHVNEQLRKALERKVWLPSGGYIVIEKTEAMTIVDVNTGRFTGTSNLEETVLKTNLEAVEEIVRQLRLRDIGGMIIIDFIDMLLKANQEQVVRRLKRELLRDRTKTRVSEVSRLGLVQMTRKNVSRGLLESFSERCDHCEGRGYTLTLESG